MNVELVVAKISDREKIDNLFHYYVYDMSEFMGWAPTVTGKYKVNASQLDVYWQRSDHYPFLIYCDGELAGFSLLRRYPSDRRLFDIGQFFVLRKFKGTGVGKKAFKLSIGKFPGRWLTRVLNENTAAFNFWQSVISDLTGGSFQITEEVDIDLKMTFIRYGSPAVSISEGHK